MEGSDRYISNLTISPLVDYSDDGTYICVATISGVNVQTVSNSDDTYLSVRCKY